MKIALIPFVLLTFSSFAQDSLSFVETENCQKPVNETPVYSTDFSWGVSIEEAKKKEVELYHSEKRLKERAYLSSGKVVMPLDVISKGLVEIPLPERFVKSIIKHVEAAFKRGYADALIFTDMGHSHFFIPQKFYDDELDILEAKDFDILYTKMINHPELKVLYHTAEQLKMLDDNNQVIPDRKISWRFFTRNLTGDNKAQGNMELLHNLEDKGNTVRSYDSGYRYWGSGFNISASKNGCFKFMRGKKEMYFDLSFKDLEPKGSDGAGALFDF